MSALPTVSYGQRDPAVILPEELRDAFDRLNQHVHDTIDAAAEYPGAVVLDAVGMNEVGERDTDRVPSP